MKILEKQVSFPSMILNVWCFGSEKTIIRKAKHGPVVTKTFLNDRFL